MSNSQAEPLALGQPNASHRSVADPPDTVHTALAALLVRKALKNEPLDVSRLLHQGDERQTRAALAAHDWRLGFRHIRNMLVFVLIALLFVERPWWCSARAGSDAPKCSDPAYYTFGWDLFDYKVSLWREGVIAVVLSADLALWGIVLGAEGFWRWRWRVFHAAVLGAMIFDVSFTLCFPFLSSWRLAPYLRVFLMLCYNTVAQRDAVNLFRSSAESLKVLVLLFCVILGYAWFAVVLFPNDGPVGQYFPTIGTAIWNLQVLLTGGYFPDMMLPGYNASRFSGLFFISFLIVGVFLLLQIVVAVIYSGYTAQLQETLEEDKGCQSDLLNAAFSLLDGDSNGWLQEWELDALLVALSRGGGLELDDARLVFTELDSAGDNRIHRTEFTELVRVLGLRLQTPQKPLVEAISPALWDSQCFQSLRRVVSSKRFDHWIDFVVLFSCVLNVVETWPYITGDRDEPAWAAWTEVVNVVITLLFFGELMVKVLILGWDRYWSKWSHRFEALVSVGAVGAYANYLFPNDVEDLTWVRLAVMLRLLRTVRLLEAVPAFRVIIKALVSIVPGGQRVLPLLTCMFLTFDVLGCDLFGGLITTDLKTDSARQLAMTSFGNSSWYPLNFNDRAGGMVTLFSLVTMASWDTYVDGYVAAAGAQMSTWGVRAFFMAWWIVGVLVGMSLAMAIVLDAFVGRWDDLHREDPPSAPTSVELSSLPPPLDDSGENG